MDTRQDFQRLMAVMIAQVDSNAGKRTNAGSDHLGHAHVLSIKLFRHIVTMYNTVAGCELERSDMSSTRYYDFSSVFVLIRAAFETHLVLHYIFSPDDPDLCLFRYKAWQFGGLKERLKLTATYDDTKEKLRITRLQHDALLIELESSSYYAAWGKYKRDKLSKEGSWNEGLGWNQLAELAGFCSTYFRDIYRYTCSHAHSDFVSVMQITDADTLEAQKGLATTGVGMANMVLAHHIRLFGRIFPESVAAYQGDAVAVSVVDKWYIRAEDMASIRPPAEE